MNGLVAAVQLLSRAGTNGFFIEYVCLSTSVIDATLRIGIILKHQLKSHNNEIIDELLFQSEEDKIISEREIYRKALKEGIITQALFAQLENLYRKRNKIIHRYIISDITTKQVLGIGIQYEKIIPKISNRIKKLEERQLELGIGMTTSDSDRTKSQMKSQLEEMSAEKHQNEMLNRALKKK